MYTGTSSQWAYPTVQAYLGESWEEANGWRRAHLNSNEVLSCHPTITISQVEYDALLKTAREFANLRRNLMRGGVTEDTLDVLTSDESKWQDNQSAGLTSEPTPGRNGTQHPIHQPHDTAVPATRVSSHSRSHGGQTTAQQPVKHHWAEPEIHEISDADESVVDPHRRTEFEIQNQDLVAPRPQFERIATRTILIVNLPEGTTHGDITAVVRGGQLLDIFLRTYDRSAQVSFLHSADAKEFFEHIRRHDLYIKQKRVDIRWSDRQFTLPGHVASKIGMGATRNIVIRRCDPNLTEEALRDDLEHIHNLRVIHVTFTGGSAYISTNSVHGAMFARTCMMSRLKYKGSKIDWDVDECTQPLAKSQYHRTSTQAAPAKRVMHPTANRFEPLNMDGLEGEEKVVPDFSLRSAMDVRV
ncbi:hypothetical protein CkaCkLH20_07020 [Colletotrichum karsti]|uniref:Negative regulator of differentiation 1 n=1 Tax=Colletotrichum karsti TaxID=1095194 RepID=A0A9P6LGV9_9PEZI|nr:uncharacterized protein CkaCkLH20_07020 [Colletotrichum karsti]KAF9875639.1 hypothetical protein CkaCkLH20_07020 [Colletotrichum karsti]